MLEQFRIEAPRLVESQDIECRSHDSGWLSPNEFNHDLAGADTLACKLMQRMHHRVIPHLIKSADV
jgi:hypothetical protein